MYLKICDFFKTCLIKAKIVNLSSVTIHLLYVDSFNLTIEKAQQLKLIRLLVGWILEDSGQNIIQYFYQEKFLLQLDLFVLVKVGIALLTTSMTLFKSGSCQSKNSQKKTT